MSKACPQCNANLNAWGSISHDDKPRSGDITVCVYCAEVLEFTDNDLNVISASAEALTDVTLELSKVQRAIRDLRKLRGKLPGER